jgi:hypothetical protein
VQFQAQTFALLLRLVHTPVVAGTHLTDEYCLEQAPAEILNSLLFGRKLTTRTAGTKQSDLKILEFVSQLSFVEREAHLFLRFAPRRVNGHGVSSGLAFADLYVEVKIVP